MFERDKKGLVKGLEYKYDEQGLIDWRAMLDDKWLYANPSSVEKGVCKRNTPASELKDKDLCIMLGGLKELAQWRGFTSVRYDVVNASPEYVAMACEISWIKNFETNNILEKESPSSHRESILFSSVADAHFGNTRSFAKNFLAAIAENRAFSRAVRNFLRINIVSDIELGEVKGQETYTEEQSTIEIDKIQVLKKLMEQKGVSFEDIKEKLGKAGYKESKNLETVEQISPVWLIEVIKKLKKKQ
jgi:DNA-binding transcriptional MerR regulator|tara:strand:+ start:2590 stop:3324 length:735 start_codon:yes stop_codon:yes gene_type:complete